MKFETFTHKGFNFQVPVGNSDKQYVAKVGRAAISFNDKQPVMSRKIEVLDAVFELAAVAKAKGNRDAHFYFMDIWKALDKTYQDYHVLVNV